MLKGPQLKGRCALITGSTQGLGCELAERLAAEGCNGGIAVRTGRRRHHRLGHTDRRRLERRLNMVTIP
jgi:NAD(P)-dependent dehydrogenase (short-subunit alcohol dehydrogenase family)